MIPDHTEALERLYRERLEDKPKLAPVVTPRSNGYAANSSGPSDADVTEKLLGERTDKGRRLWEGDTSGYESASEADLGLLEKLAFYTREVEQLERMWYESGLYRQKLARADYRQRTIAKALERVTETYDWSRLTVPGGFPRVSALGRGCTADSSDSSDGFSKSSPLKNVPMFPTDALPSKVARYVEEAAASLSCSPELVAIPAIAALSGVMGRTREVRIKRGWTVSGSLYRAVVASAGEKKTPAQSAAIFPVEKLQGILRNAYKEEKKTYEKDMRQHVGDK